MAASSVASASIVCLSILCTLAEGSTEDTFITDITPGLGSTQGETRVTIYGDGFAENQFNFGGDSAHLGNQVMMVSDKAEYVCTIHMDGCTETQIMCYTVAMPAGEYYIRVFVDGVAVPLPSHCGHIEGRHHKCRFTAHEQRTPNIEKVVMSDGEPGSVLEMYGRLYSSLYGTNVAASTNGRTEKISRVYAGSLPCELIMEGTDDFYKLELDKNGASDKGWMHCKMTGTYVGHHNLSFIVSGEYGRSRPEPGILNVNRRGKVYMFQTYADIYNISPSVSSDIGGGVLTINGKNFDESDYPAEVLLGGEPCDIISLSDTEIQCRIPGEPLEPSLVGNRGWKRESWFQEEDYRASLEEVGNFTDPENITWNNNGEWTETVDLSRYVNRFRGFFVPPSDNEYKFFLKGDDSAELYLSDGEDPDNKKKIAEAFLAKDYNIQPEQQSDIISLKGDKPYYLEVVHKENRGGAFAQVAVHMYHTDYTGKTSGQVKNERQKIFTTSDRTNERQTISFDAWTTGVPVQEVQEVEVMANNPGSAYFRLGINGVYTATIQGDASADVVRNRLNAIPTIFPDTVQVTSQELFNPFGIRYTITFESERGDFPDFDVMEDESSSVSLAFNLHEVTKGQASGRYIQLQCGDAPSLSLIEHSELNSDKIKLAVENLFEVYCPRNIALYWTGFAYMQDYEHGTGKGIEYGTRSNEIEPLCGGKSSKNPNMIFRRDPNTLEPIVDLVEAPNLCFGHHGILLQKVYVLYNFRMSDSEKQRSSGETFDFVLDNQREGWSYNCINLYEAISARRGVGILDVFLDRVIIYKENSASDLYVDQVTFARNPTTTDTIGIAKYQRLRPASFSLDAVTVEDVTNPDDGTAPLTFDITLDQRNCPTGLALFSLCNGKSVSTSADSASFEYAPGSSVTSTRTQAASPPVAGMFDITYRGKRKRNIPADAMAHEMKGLLEPFFDEGSLAVTREGTCTGYTWTVEWQTEGGDKPSMEINYRKTTGNNVTMAIESLNDGGIFYDPIPGDMLFSFTEQPQVTLTINDIPSRCQGDCSFRWSSEASATVTSMTPGSGVAGESVTVDGAGFGNDAAAVSVKIGGADCAVTLFANTQIICAAGEAPAGTYAVNVIVGTGRASHENSTKEFTYDLVVNSVDPAEGSLGGGTIVTITGSGFSSSLSVSVGDNPCTVMDIHYDNVTCKTGTASSAGNAAVVLTQDSLSATADTQFNYRTALTPTVTSVSETNAAVEGGTTITIIGSGFSASASSDDAVSVGGVTAVIVSYSNIEIKVILPSQAPGSYPLEVSVEGKGYADVSAVGTINYNLRITNIFPRQGSLEGGSLVTIFGTGFSYDITNNNIKFGAVPCEVVSSSSSQIICRLGKSGTVHEITNQGEHPELGVGFAWQPSSLAVKVGDTVHWKWATPDLVDGVKYKVEQTQDALTNNSKNNGFNSGGDGTRNGEFVYQVTDTGFYYYWSNWMDTVERISLRGTIQAEARESCAENLVLRVAGYEAVYDTASDASDPSDSSSCSPDNTVPSGCTGPTGIDSTFFSFGFWSCLTSHVNAISPLSGDSQGDITITGSGFSTTDCQNVVTFGGHHPCIVKSSSDSQIVCNLDTSDGSMPVGKMLDVDITINNRGSAMVMPKNNRQRGFEVVPVVDSVSPPSGSLKGATRLTITGSGLCNNCASSNRSVEANVVVYIGTVPCEVESADYDSIVCNTAEPPGGQTRNVDVSINADGEAISADCSSSCSFSFNSASTPTVASLDPAVITEYGSTLTLTGTQFGSIAEEVEVMIGDVACAIDTISDTEISCTVSEVLVGNQAFSLIVASKGKADSQQVLQVSAVIDGISPTSGSTEGGLSLIISGIGFGSDASVEIDSETCEVVSVTGSQIVCLTPVHAEGSVKVSILSGGVTYTEQDFTYDSAATPGMSDVAPSSGVSGDSITIAGSGFGSISEEAHVSINGSECSTSAVSDTSITCTLGGHGAGNFTIEVTIAGKGKAAGSHDFQYIIAIDSLSSSEGSMAGGQALTLTGRGFDSSTVVTICDLLCNLQGDLTSTRVICRTPGNSGSGTVPCNVKAYAGFDEAISSTEYMYKDSLTPDVTGVSPARGGTAGGTRITISGAGFGVSQSAVSVNIGGVDCPIASFSSSAIECITEARKPSVKAQVEVSVAGNGIARQTSAGFEYVDRWSSQFSWGGADPPVEGDFVVIPSDMTIMLDVDTPVLKMLLIQGGQLIFDEKDVELNAENILITDGGLLQVGTEDAPFQHSGIITLHGHPRSKELPIYGTKTLAVREGTLDLHGKPVGVSWTLLGETASQGSQQIVLQQPVSWEVGAEIAIATTGTRHTQSENEVARIAAVSSDGLTLDLESPLAHSHLGETVAVQPGVTLEARAEVALLTRNVKVRGSDNLEWHGEIEACDDEFNTGEFATQTCFQGRHGEDIGSDMFGSQIMFHAPRRDEGLVKGRLEDVEITYAGQAFRLGRYPIHFHLNGDMAGSYVRSIAIHKSFNRAVNIHGTHNILVERNTLYNIMGGAFFLEDGVETGNIFQYNVAIFVISSTSLQNDDITPAAFWITNANNTVRHNHAAGGTHFGYWYRMLEHPDGPSFDENICPQKVPLGEFTNNTVHSQGQFGVWVFQCWNPSVGGCCDCEEPELAKFNRLTAWNNEKGAEFVGTGSLQVLNGLFVQNEDCGVEVKMLEMVDPYVEDKTSSVVSSIIASYAGVLDTKKGKKGIVVPLGRGYIIRDTTFVNYDGNSVGVFQVAKIEGMSGDFNGGFTYQLYRNEFVNCPRKVYYQWDHEAVYHDVDGSMTGVTNGKVLAATPILPPECTVKADYSVLNPGVVCPGNLDFHRFAWNEFSPKSLEGQNVTFENEYGTSISQYYYKRMTHKKGWIAVLQSEQTYQMTFVHSNQITNISYTGKVYDMLPNQYMIIQHNFTQRADRFTVTKEPRNESDAMVTYNSNTNGDWYFQDDETLFSYLVSGKDASAEELSTVGSVDRAINLDVYRCYFADCLTPVDPSTEPPVTRRPSSAIFWSDTESWAVAPEGFGGNYGDGNYGLPRENDDVKIPIDTWMVLDVEDLPTFGKIFVDGVLEFEYQTKANSSDYYTFSLECDHIIINGGRVIVGWEDKPFLGSAEVVLKGDHNSPDFPTDNGPNVGGKAIAVFGGLDMHGAPRSVSWTKLAATVNAGDLELTLEDVVDWVVGEEVIVATTSYNASESERLTITGISEDGLTLTMETAFEYKHIAVTETTNGIDYQLAAEVGLLSRNVKIVGKSYPKQDDQAFGVRVLVGTKVDGNKERKGYARLSNVEFSRAGQLGWIDYYDPRFSLTYLALGTVTEINPSYVRSCAFNYNFAPAIGVFGTEGVPIEDNVVYHTVGSSIIDWGDKTELRRNLVVNMVNAGTYRDRNIFQILWGAAFNLQMGTGVILEGNTVAGSERGGFRVDGQACGTTTGRWANNMAHSCHLGVFLLPDPDLPNDGISPCTLIAGFTVWKNYDYGIYVQTGFSTELDGVVSIDNGHGVFGFIYSPESIDHKYADKTMTVRNSVVIGASAGSDCGDTLDMMEKNMVNSEVGRGMRTGTNGKVGITFAVFASKDNGAPRKIFKESTSYQAINGLLTVESCTFSKFSTVCDGRKEFAIAGVDSIDDAQHPLRISGTTLENVDTDNLAFIPRPRIDTINPSDCVDMDCDGLKKCILDDLDGTFLGSVGTIISESEWEWDGDSRRGLGDYRIPKTMLTNLDGSKIEVDEIASHRGIIRDDSCVYKPAYQAWECHGVDYEMLHIESLDSDTETRRLSPVGIIGDRYLDLINGPQDHTWCMGYTCQARLSLFPFAIAASKYYELHYSGTSPQDQRLHFLNTDDSQAFVIGIMYAQPWRLDVMVDGVYQLPKNGELNDIGQLLLAYDDVDYMPDMTNDPTGACWFNRETQILYVKVRGSTPVDIVTVDSIFVSFDLGYMSADEFFGEEIVSNLAAYLDIPEDRIKVAEAVREDGGRRRRASIFVLTIEISNPPRDYDDLDPADLTQQEMYDMTQKLINAYQLEEMPSILNITDIISMTIIEPPLPTNSPEWVIFVETEMSPEIYLQIPSVFVVRTAPAGIKESTPFTTQPVIVAKDANGNTISQLGSTMEPWILTASLRYVSGNYQNALLSGLTSVPYSVSEGFHFVDLKISHEGEYFLDFAITSPSDAISVFSVTSLAVTVGSRLLSGKVVNLPGSSDGPFDVTVGITDEDTGEIVENVDWKGHTFQCTVSLYMPEIYKGHLLHEANATVDSGTGLATFENLEITYPGRYFLNFNCKSSPEEYDFDFIGEALEIFPVGYVVPIVTVEKEVRIRFYGDFSQIVEGKEKYFAAYLYNHLDIVMRNVTMENVEITEGSIIADLTLGGTEARVDTLVKDIWLCVSEEHRFEFNGYEVIASGEMWVDGEVYDDDAKSGSLGLAIYLIVIAVLGTTVICGMMAVLVCCLVCKKKNHLKKVQPHTPEYPTDSCSNRSDPALSEKKLLDDKYMYLGLPPCQDTYIDSGRASCASTMSAAMSAYGNTRPLSPADRAYSASIMSAATSAYGNTRPLIAGDLPVRMGTPVSAGRHNGPMLTTNLRRDSSVISTNLKMPGVDNARYA